MSIILALVTRANKIQHQNSIIPPPCNIKLYPPISYSNTNPPSPWLMLSSQVAIYQLFIFLFNKDMKIIVLPTLWLFYFLCGVDVEKIANVCV